MSGFLSGDLRTVEAIREWSHYKRNLERRKFRERQARIDWREFARGSYRVAVECGSRLVYRGGSAVFRPE
ncbi:MAG TPA: hypothetical protein VG936_13855 [Lacunisphaera sp.]|nr:hypothetical protein [Lacunisphaera sp.]